MLPYVAFEGRGKPVISQTMTSWPTPADQARHSCPSIWHPAPGPAIPWLTGCAGVSTFCQTFCYLTLQPRKNNTKKVSNGRARLSQRLCASAPCGRARLSQLTWEGGSLVARVFAARKNTFKTAPKTMREPAVASRQGGFFSLRRQAAAASLRENNPPRFIYH